MSRTSSIVALPVQPRPRDTLGRPLHDLRISVMDRCNFRCPYCMPQETFHEHYRFLKSTERLSFEEITRLTRLFVQLGVKKVRLTGGEPLLRPNLSELVGELTALEGVQDVALTTNAVLLAQHAAELKANGLHRITVSLDTLDPEIFKQMSGGFAERDRVLEGIRAAQDAGLTPIKINAVDRARPQRSHRARPGRALPRHRRHRALHRVHGRRQSQSLEPAIASCRRASWSSASARAGRCTPCEENYRGEVAERYAFDDGAGEVGFISSVTNPFCGDCTRARLSSEGVFYTCLFATLGRWICARRCATARRDDELRSTHPQHLDCVAAIATANCARSLQPASSRCARSRCITSAAEPWLRSLTSIPPRARPWSMSATRPSRKRTATAETRVRFPREVAEALRAQQFSTPKGPVFQTAIIAGVMAAKRTHELIPFCHPLGIENCKLAIDMDGDDAVIRCTVSVHHKTGVEMEALTGASVAALTIYDMCKALSHDIVIAETRLVEKRGGKSDIG